MNCLVLCLQAAHPLSLGNDLALLGGFLSFKVALLQQQWEELRPQPTAQERRRPYVQFEADELDLWGRARRQQDEKK